MNPQRGQPAARLLASLDAPGLARLLEAHADQPDVTALAQVIIERQQRAPITTTNSSRRDCGQAPAGPDRGDRSPKGVVDSFAGSSRRSASPSTTSPGALETFLRLLPACVIRGGRVAIVTFHSGENRRVKQAFKEGVRSGAFVRVAEEVVRPSADERRATPRSAAAKLRLAIRA